MACRPRCGDGWGGGRVSGRRMCGPRGGLGKSYRRVAARPCPCGINGATRALIERKPEDALGAVGRPGGEQAMLVWTERAAAVRGDKPAVSHLNRSAALSGG
jgi:hypothetical protein